MSPIHAHNHAKKRPARPCRDRGLLIPIISLIRRPRFFVAFAGWLNRHQAAQLAYLAEENRVLREHLGNRRLLLTDVQRHRLAAKAKAVGRRGLLQLSTIVTPDTLMRWYRRLIAHKYDGSMRRGPGRPRTPKKLADLVVRLANENPSWGYTRIRGNLAVLGHQIGRSTIARILAEHGIDPAPQRPMQWSTFLQAHWGAVCAADFFTVEVLTPLGLSRRHVLFVIDLETRAVEIAGIVAEPYEQWIMVSRSSVSPLAVQTSTPTRSDSSARYDGSAFLGSSRWETGTFDTSSRSMSRTTIRRGPPRAREPPAAV